MFSTLLDIIGLALIVLGVYLLAGLGVAAIVGGVAFLVVGWATDGMKIKPFGRGNRLPGG
jgi:hypothetical protein